MRAWILATVVASVIVGAVITLLTGNVITPTLQLGVDVVHYGVPISWTMLVIPTRFKSIDYPNLAIDLLFWAITVFTLCLGINGFGIKAIQAKGAHEKLKF